MYIKTLQFYPNVIKSYARFFFMASSFSRSCLASRVRVGFVALFVFFLCLDLSENARTYAQEEQYNREAQESGVHLPHMMGTMRHRRDRYQKQNSLSDGSAVSTATGSVGCAAPTSTSAKNAAGRIKLGRCLWCKQSSKRGRRRRARTSEAKTTTTC